MGCLIGLGNVADTVFSFVCEILRFMYVDVLMYEDCYIAVLLYATANPSAIVRLMKVGQCQSLIDLFSPNSA